MFAARCRTKRDNETTRTTLERDQFRLFSGFSGCGQNRKNRKKIVSRFCPQKSSLVVQGSNPVFWPGMSGARSLWPSQKEVLHVLREATGAGEFSVLAVRIPIKVATIVSHTANLMKIHSSPLCISTRDFHWILLDSSGVYRLLWSLGVSDEYHLHHIVVP